MIGNATTGTLYNEFTTAMTDETGTANVKLIFTSGYPGKYFVYFQCGSLKTDPVSPPVLFSFCLIFYLFILINRKIQIYLQNQVASVTLNSSTSAMKLQYLYPGDFIIAYLRDIKGISLSVFPLPLSVIPFPPSLSILCLYTFHSLRLICNIR